MKNIFISGVSSGIGQYLAQNLTNCTVSGCSRTLPSFVLKKFYPCDLSDEHQVVSLTKKLSEESFDCFVLNAGVGHFGNFSSLSLQQEKEMLMVNFWANLVLVKQLLSEVSPQTVFVFIGSVASKTLFAGGAGYQASKFALRGLVGALRKEFGSRFFLINPKIVETNFHKNSNLDIDAYKKTSLDSILDVVKLILEGKQDQWEIDL